MCEDYQPNFDMGQTIWYVPRPTSVNNYEEDYVIEAKVIAKEHYKAVYADDETVETFKYKVEVDGCFRNISAENFELYVTREEAEQSALKVVQANIEYHTRWLESLEKIKDKING